MSRRRADLDRTAQRRPGRYGWALALALALAACSTAPEQPRSPTASDRPSSGPRLTVDSVLAPVTRHGERELARLPRGAEPVATLRRSHILIETRREKQALSELNLLLFGDRVHSADVRAYAHYLRSRAFASLGDSERADHEGTTARDLALDLELRARIDRERTPPAPPTKEKPALGRPTALPRSAWGAARGRTNNMAKMGRIERITVHHSASIARANSQRAAQAAIRAIQRYHQEQRGWADIGYHYLIDPAGRLWTGRPASWQGAHAGDPRRNRHNLGICLLGNFVSGRGGQQPTAAQLQTLDQLVRYVADRHGVPAAEIHTHRELNDSTACPGARLQVAVDRLRDRLQAAE